MKVHHNGGNSEIMSSIDIKKRNISLDIAKGIGIILVVLGHTKAPEELINFIFCFHMPLFFLISGYLFNFEKWKYRFSCFFQSRMERLIIPYFLTSLCFFYPFWFFLGRHFGKEKELDISPIKEFVGIFYGSAADHYLSFNIPLWFLPCLFISELIFFFILKHVKTIELKIITILGMSVLGIMIGKLYALPWSIDIAMVVQIFLGVGYVLKIKKFNISVWIGIASLSILLIDVHFLGRVDTASRYYKNALMYFVGGISGTLFILWISDIIARVKYISKLFSYLGMQSMTIFIWHIFGFKITSIFLVYGIGLSLAYAHENYYIIYTVSAILISLCILYIKNKIYTRMKSKGYIKLARLINW